jgi:tRNA(Ile)-lysidine synthase
MQKWEQKFIDFIKEYDLLEGNSNVLLALSGGSDSVFCFLLFEKFQELLGIKLHCFHMNHMLRDEADHDEAFVRKMCETYNVPIMIKKTDVSAYAASLRLNLEDAGRSLRYEALNDFASSLGDCVIATAHHMDDNTESVLMHLIRGTSVTGLRGILPKQGRLIRPLLPFTKEEIIDCLAEHEFVTDVTNFSDSYFRNRIRSKLIPYLKTENPRVGEAVFRLSRSAAEYEAFADQQLKNADIPILSESQGSCSVPVSKLLTLDEVLIKRLFSVLAAAALGSEVQMTYEGLKKLTALLKGSNDLWKYSVAGVVFSQVYDKLYARPKDSVVPFDTQFYDLPILANAVHFVASAGLVIRTTTGKKNEKNYTNSYIKVIDYDRIKKNLTIRNSRVGDSFSPLGFGEKTKTLNRFFVDKKIPIDLRKRTPIFLDGEKIVCVGTFALDEFYKVTDETKQVIEINVEFM